MRVASQPAVSSPTANTRVNLCQMPRFLLARTLSEARNRPVAVAVGAVAASSLLRFVLAPMLGDAAPMLAYLLGVSMAAVVGGVGSGIMATCLSIPVGAFLFLELRGVLPARLEDVVRLGVFAGEGLLIAVATGQLHVQVDENQRLAGQVRLRNQELETANRELDAFSYSVSHDLRAPLRAIDGYARILVEDHLEALDADARRALQVIVSETRRMSLLIDDLLAFSRMSQAVVEEAEIDMPALARSTWQALTVSLPDAPPVMIGDLPPARGDAAMLRHLWQNLLDNALKFTRGRSPVRIEVGFHAQEGAYYVRDNGAGFDMRFSGKLFQVFQRLHSEQEFEGTGVGLALVRRIVERHGGRVWADGRVDGGATVYFTLPGLKGSMS